MDSSLPASEMFHIAGPSAYEPFPILGRVVGTEVGICLVRLGPLPSWTRGSWGFLADVLEVYQRPRDPQRPLVCLDETSKQLIIDTRARSPPNPDSQRVTITNMNTMASRHRYSDLPSTSRTRQIGYDGALRPRR
jgi:hypothetical protein